MDKVVEHGGHIAHALVQILVSIGNIEDRIGPALYIRMRCIKTISDLIAEFSAVKEQIGLKFPSRCLGEGRCEGFLFPGWHAQFGVDAATAYAGPLRG